MEDKPRLSVGLKVIGWYAIIRAGFSLLLDQSQIDTRSWLVTHPPSASPYAAPAALHRLSDLMLFTDIASNVIFLVAGIALLRRKGWARFLILCASVRGIVVLFAELISHGLWFRLDIFGAVWSFASLAFWAFTIYFLSRQAIRTQFTATTPLVRAIVVVAVCLTFIPYVALRRSGAESAAPKKSAAPVYSGRSFSLNSWSLSDMRKFT